VNRLHVPPRKLKEPDFDTMRAAGLTRWHLEEG
jgi:hypothetical protein